MKKGPAGPEARPFELPLLVVGEDTSPLEAEAHRLGACDVSALEVEHYSVLGVADHARALGIDVIAYPEEPDAHTLHEILEDFGVEQIDRVVRMMKRLERT
jgi:hypothetical protein